MNKKNPFDYFDKIVSLGCECSPAFYIRYSWFVQFKKYKNCASFFGEDLKNEYPHGSFLFDNLTIPDINSIVGIFKCNFSSIFESEYMKSIRRLDKNKLCAVDTKNNLMFYHLSELDEKFGPSSVGRRRYRTIFTKNYTIYKKKYDYLSSKMVNLINSDLDVLFITYADQPYLKFTHDLMDVLSTFSCNASLLVLYSDKKLSSKGTQLPEKVYAKYVTGNWSGNCTHQESWLNALKEFKFKN
jgi:hypothetical protein